MELRKKATAIGIHYDVYPTSKEDLNVILFELLILGSLSDNNCNVFYLPTNTKIYIEISQSLNSPDKRDTLLFSLFKNEVIKFNNFNGIKVGTTKDDKYQKVCKYLSHVKASGGNMDKYDIKKIYEKDSKPLEEAICIAIIKTHIADKLKKPNYYYINSFVTFVADQLERLEKSPFFSDFDRLKNMFEKHLIGPTRTKRAKELHFSIVNNLIELAYKISIIEKFQD